VFLKKQIQSMAGKTFLEIGPGFGDLSGLMLKNRMTGSLIELSEVSCQLLSERFKKQIAGGNLRIRNESFLTASIEEKYDLVVSAMVLEHLNDSAALEFLKKCEELLSLNGVLLLFVPSSPRHWGIEDEIAGHFRRYSREMLFEVVGSTKLKIDFVYGLTFPLSNILLPISNFLVKRSEISKAQLSRAERTLLSGHREVKYKVIFPKYFKLLLNELTLFPFIVLQKVYRGHPDSLVLVLGATKTP
jgi:2-polyprenyl-3-methyl-5-hydroxy-6-metoxy-1,4-benzoquinol methylase